MEPSAKYYTGQYAVCRTCGARPCLCDAAPQSMPAANVRSLHRRDSGNAIPFAIWDYLIGEYELTIIESGLYALLCRETVGRGRHGGAQLSLAQLAGAIRLSRREVARALIALEAHGLIARTQLCLPGKRSPAATHIRVIVPDPK